MSRTTYVQPRNRAAINSTVLKLLALARNPNPHEGVAARDKAAGMIERYGVERGHQDNVKINAAIEALRPSDRASLEEMGGFARLSLSFAEAIGLIPADDDEW